MKMRYLLLPFALLATTANAGERLEGDVLEAFWKDKTMVGTHHKLGPIKTFHGADGRVHSKAASGSERKGKWWIGKNRERKCIRWQGDGKKRCHFTVLNADGSHALIHGKKGHRIVAIETMLDGNQL